MCLVSALLYYNEWLRDSENQGVKWAVREAIKTEILARTVVPYMVEIVFFFLVSVGICTKHTAKARVDSRANWRRGDD